MGRRALLIGSETYGLAGCNADVALMRDVLTARGFDRIDVRVGDEASRAGIVDGLDELVGSITGADDGVLVYYSGHGGRVTRPDFEERRAQRASVHFQFIVPFDMDQSDTGDFRGVLSEELTWYQRRLTDAFGALHAVPNVTTILDCCHSGYMARAIDTRPKSVDLTERMFRLKGVRDHVMSLAAGMELHGLVTNADAVRLVACQPEESAFEFPSSRGGRHGAFTDALASVLDDLDGAPATWATVNELVRRRVRALVPEQRPDVEGPAERMLFSTRTLPTDALALSTVEGDIRIEAASLLGVAIGDEFTLITPASDELGTATVETLDGGAAVLTVTPPEAAAAVADGGLAVPRRVRRPPAPVHLDIPSGAGRDLRKRIGERARLCVVADRAGAFAVVTTDGETLVLGDGTGARWRIDGYPDTPAGRGRIVDDLDDIAVGHRLLDLPSGLGANALDGVVSIGFGSAVAGVRQPLGLHGERIAVGTPVWLSLTNTAAEPVYVWIFDVGVSGRSTLLTNAAKSGTELGPAGTETETCDLWDGDGEALVWPDDVPIAVTGEPARWESFVVIAADQRGDLASLASRQRSARGLPQSPLQAVVDEARTGVREVAAATSGAEPLRYRIEVISFLLDPA